MSSYIKSKNYNQCQINNANPSNDQDNTYYIVVISAVISCIIISILFL